MLGTVRSRMRAGAREIVRGRREPEVRLLAGCAVALVPWIAVLAVTLPARAVARNWSLAWSGFDVLLAALLAGTAWLRRRGDVRVGALAGASAAMLLADAWFDTSTSAKGWDSAVAVCCAVFVELPLAVVCARIALRVGR